VLFRSVLSSFKGRRCLVTGAHGFIGSTLACSLRQAGAELFSPRRDELDVSDAVALCAQVHAYAPECVFHLASEGVGKPVTPEQLRRSNVDGTKNLVSALATLPSAPRVVLLGSGFEYAAKEGPLIEGDEITPFSDYGVSKVDAAALARQEGGRLPLIWVRLFNVYGPGEPEARLLPYLARRASEGLPVEVTGGEQLRDFTYVDDVAEGLLRLALSMPARPAWEVCNLGSGHSIRLRDFIQEGMDGLRERGDRKSVV